MRNLLLILLLILPFSACNKDDNFNIINLIIETGLIKNQTMSVSGVNRKYHLFVPQNYNNAPIVIIFHGHSSDYDKLIESTPYNVWLQKAEQENII